MTEEVKKRGRGRKALPQAEKQRHQVNSRLTDAELAHVDAHRGGVTRGEWLRRAAFGHAPRTIPALNREAWIELSRAAANLNQLARNSHTFTDVNVIEALKFFRAALIGASLEADDESEG
jgi:hypothetical protein